VAPIELLLTDSFPEYLEEGRLKKKKRETGGGKPHSSTQGGFFQGWQTDQSSWVVGGRTKEVKRATENQKRLP